MLIFVINCGSSSVKYCLFAGEGDGELDMLARGMVSGLNQETATLRYVSGDTVHTASLAYPDYRAALEAAIATLLHPEYGQLKDVSEIDVVGHRTVHGGEKFIESVLIDDEVLAKMEECIGLAPIHNPANLEGIRQAMYLLPGTPQVAVFDTAFHQSIPVHARVYALPYAFYEERGIRKYGFHGTSCMYAAQRVCQLLNRKAEESRIVICHLGNGVSVTAVDKGKSVDTSLGYTSVGGMMMGTRCGDVDPGVILALMRELNLNAEEMDQVLHHQSGLLGVSGLNNDMKTIEEAAADGNERCQLAIEMFSYQMKKYIGAYAAVMGGIDMLVFTGGIGENSVVVRKLAVDGLDFLGLHIDTAKNEHPSGDDFVISPNEAQAKVVVIKANEEKMIALEAERILQTESIAE